MQLTPERWRQVEPILDELLDRSPDQRRERLAALGRGDAALREEVESLLDAYESAPTFLDDEAAAFVAPAIVDDGAIEPPAAPGLRLGPWELDREIGRGGMSVVFAAHRADGQFDQRVAIKIFDYPGRDRESLERRFEEERRILAALDHPNIARVLDGGVTRDARPYLVMEYVDGESLTGHCAARAAGLGRRLDLFLAVCGAVEHAHRRLVVHRDLKPANVLVSDTGVKLLDFGIAKLLGEGADPALETRTGLFLMTPQYAAPEQVRGETVTTATDVYALGLLLYELLAGRPPYTVGGKTASEIERVICEREPERPSGKLDGDLATVVLKALAKEPERRYPSVTALAEDIRRYREGWPVTARAPSLGYRASKFVRRHRLAVSAAAVVLSTLLGAGIMLVREQSETRRQRDRALVEAEKARELSDFMVGLFEAGDPHQNRGREPTARELLTAGVGRVTRLKESPSAQVDLLDAMARAHRHLGDHETARTLLEQAVEIEAGLDPSSYRHSVILNHLAMVVRRLGDAERAETLYEQALKIQRDTAAPDDLATTLANYGYFLVRKGRYDDGDRLLRESLALLESSQEPDEARIADTLSKLANLEHARSNPEAARELATRALETARRALGDHPRVAEYASNLAVLHRRTGDAEAAKSLYESALATLETVHGRRHPVFSMTLANYAYLLRSTGETDHARALFEEALDITLETLGAENRQAAQQFANLGRLHYAEGRLDEAEPLLTRALEIRRGMWGPDHPDVSLSCYQLGQLELKRRDYAAAEPWFRESLRLNRSIRGDEHRSTAWSAIYLAAALTGSGAFEEAERLLHEAAGTLAALFGEEHDEYRQAARRLSSLYERWGREELASEWAARAGD